MKKLLLLVLVAACGSGSAGPVEQPDEQDPPEPTETELTEPGEPGEPGEPEAPNEHEAQMRAVASEYQAWGRTDDQMKAAPTACAAPPQAPRARASTSEDGATHGQKLYSVWAKDRTRYANGNEPVGQVVVKESWVPELVTDPASVPSPWNSNEFHPYATIDGKTYKAGEPAGLFVLMKIGAAATPGTDDGWIYGTIAPDGTVTSSGMVETCMGCHQSAKHDRIFGPNH